MKRQKIIEFIFLWLCFANIFIALIIYPINQIQSSIYGLKDVPYYLIAILSLLLSIYNTNWVIKRSNVIYFIGLIYIIFALLISSAGIVSKIAAIRQIVGFFVIYGTVSFLSNKRDVNDNKIIRIIIYSSIPIILIGWLANYLSLWDNDIIRHYFIGKSIGIVQSGYPAHFIAILPFEIFGKNEILRETSIFLDPINYGHILVFWIVLITQYHFPKSKSKRKLFILISFATILLTFSKGALLQLFLIYYLLNKNLNKMMRVVVALLFLFYFAYIYLLNVRLHVDGFIIGIKNAGFFGQGLGMVGNYASMLGDSNIDGLGDSYWGSLFGQIGWIGGIIFIFSIIHIYKQIPNSLLLIKNLFLSQFLIGVFSENALNISSCFGVAIVSAIVIQNKLNYKIKNYVTADCNN